MAIVATCSNQAFRSKARLRLTDSMLRRARPGRPGRSSRNQEGTSANIAAAQVIMQINATSTTDAALAGIATDNQIQIAVAVKAREAQKLQGEAMISLLQDAAQISDQIATGHIDVEL